MLGTKGAGKTTVEHVKPHEKSVQTAPLGHSSESHNLIFFGVILH